MSEAARNLAPVLDRPLSDTLADVLPPVRPAEHNDNEATTELLAGEQRGFEVPPRLWIGMVACYGVFISALLFATGGGESTLNILISAFYMVMFFGLVKLLVQHGPQQARSPLDGSSRILQTLYGPLKEREVAAQMLVVPLCVAFFGVAILVIRLWVA
jgi:hypothetical protein